MKGFTKVLLIMAAFTFLFGTGITVAAASLGGRMPRAVTIDSDWYVLDWIYDDDDPSKHGEHTRLRSAEIEDLEDIEYLPEDMMAEGEALNDAEVLWDADAVMSSVGCSKLEISVDAAGVKIVEEETDGSVYLKEAGEHIVWNQEIDDDTLEVTIGRRRKGNFVSWDDGRAQAVLIIPAGGVFQEIEIKVGAGKVDVGTLTASKLDLEAGAGSIIVDNGQALELSVDCQAGSVEYTGAVERKLEADCEAGNVELYLAGAKEDFSYELEVSMGNIEIDGEEYRGLETEKKFTYEGAVKKAELECEVGNMEVVFYQ